jgi:hypothetical protein
VNEDQIVYVGQVACRKCKREVVIYLAAPPDRPPLTDEDRRMVEERLRLRHEDDCLGR